MGIFENWDNIMEKASPMTALDFEKAYDRVSWDNIRETFMMRKFGTRWCGWIKDYLTPAKTRIVSGEGEGKEIKYHRGLDRMIHYPS